MRQNLFDLTRLVYIFATAIKEDSRRRSIVYGRDAKSLEKVSSYAIEGVV